METPQALNTVQITEETSTKSPLFSLFLLCYFFPLLLFFTLASARIFQEELILCLGAVSIAGCGLVLYVNLRKWESSLWKRSAMQVYEKIKNAAENIPTTKIALEAISSQKQDTAIRENHEHIPYENSQVQVEISELKEALQESLQENKKEKDRHEYELMHLGETFEEKISTKNRQLVQVETINSELYQKLEEIQREKETLELEIRNLQFELKTLLKVGTKSLHENIDSQSESDFKTDVKIPFPETPQIDSRIGKNAPSATQEVPITNPQAPVILQNCLDVALRIAQGSGLKGQNGRFFDLSVGALAIETRRLFASLKEETEAPIFVFSRQEEKMLFATTAIRAFLGYQEERFLKDFFLLLARGKEEFEKKANALKQAEIAHISLYFKSRSTKIIPCSCYLGLCPLPPFSQCIIGVLDKKEANF